MFLIPASWSVTRKLGVAYFQASRLRYDPASRRRIPVRLSACCLTQLPTYDAVFTLIAICSCLAVYFGAIYMAAMVTIPNLLYLS